MLYKQEIFFTGQAPNIAANKDTNSESLLLLYSFFSKNWNSMYIIFKDGTKKTSNSKKKEKQIQTPWNDLLREGKENDLHSA